jgi:predicted RNase H-like HicB family nuclease
MPGDKIRHEVIKMKKKVKVLKYTAIFEPAEEGGYIVTVPSLPGLVTEGDTFEEATEMVKDAIKSYCASLIKHREPIPQEPEEEFIGTVEVLVPVPA